MARLAIAVLYIQSCLVQIIFNTICNGLINRYYASNFCLHRITTSIANWVSIWLGIDFVQQLTSFSNSKDFYIIFILCVVFIVFFSQLKD